MRHAFLYALMAINVVTIGVNIWFIQRNNVTYTGYCSHVPLQNESVLSSMPNKEILVYYMKNGVLFECHAEESK